MKPRAQEIIAQGNKLFAQRSNLMAHWQDLALNFNPMRADFTTELTSGQDFASHLMTSRPLLAHRDLSNAISSMLRPRSKEWFHARTSDDAINEDVTCRAWLDEKSDHMRKIMLDPKAQLVKATKQGDSDFTLIGWCVIQPEINAEANGLIHRTWHPRDVAYCESAELVINVVHRNWDIEARALVKLFPKTVSDLVKKLAEKDPYKKIKCRHVVMPADEYDLNTGKDPKGGKKVSHEKFPFVSIYVDTENDTILEELPRKRLGYIIPRWVTLPGSPYPHSLATVYALPDSRMLQRISLTLLEAGEMSVNPALKATRGAVGAVNWFPGGITWVDQEYDEKSGAAVEALMKIDKNLNFGENIEKKIEQLITEAFYLNKIALPPADIGGDMTKWEGQQRVEEYIRNALPLFEPMEVEYNAALCDEDWNLIMDMNGFGSKEQMLAEMPEQLRGHDIRWQFETPLREANERQKSEAFVQAGNILAIAAGMAQSGDHDFDISKGKRDALLGVGVQADWLLSPEQVQASQDAAAQAQQAQQLAATVATGADVAGKVGAGVQQLQQAGMV